KTPLGARNIFRTVTHGASFGANSLRLEIGLGDATEIQSLEVRWPGSDTRQTFHDLKLNNAYELREGAGQVLARAFKKIPLKPENRGHVAYGDGLQPARESASP